MTVYFLFFLAICAGLILGSAIVSLVRKIRRPRNRYVRYGYIPYDEVAERRRRVEERGRAVRDGFKSRRVR